MSNKPIHPMAEGFLRSMLDAFKANQLPKFNISVEVFDYLTSQPDFLNNVLATLSEPLFLIDEWKRTQQQPAQTAIIVEGGSEGGVEPVELAIKPANAIDPGPAPVDDRYSIAFKIPDSWADDAKKNKYDALFWSENDPESEGAEGFFLDKSTIELREPYERLVVKFGANRVAEFGPAVELERGQPKFGEPYVSAGNYWLRVRGVDFEVAKRVVARYTPNARLEVDSAKRPPDLWTPRQRAAANIAAMQLLAEQKPEWTDADRRVFAQYSGWGGLSLRDVASQFPKTLPMPEKRGLIHEYYTPSIVTDAIAKAMQGAINKLPSLGGRVITLEPSAGIGRFIQAFTGPAFASLSFRTVEWSRVSAMLLGAMRPDANVFQGSFEEWVNNNERKFSGRIGLLLSNPPYGERGESFAQDKNKAYRKGLTERRAYAYFMQRGLGLLAAGGVAVYLVPAGFLTGSAQREFRETIIRRNRLLAAFRLPSGLFPGAELVTDLLFFRARGKDVVSQEDDYIISGGYFDRHPANILGVERIEGKKRREDAADDDQTKIPRFGYQVEGTFTGFPEDFDLPGLIERAAIVEPPVNLDLEAEANGQSGAALVSEPSVASDRVQRRAKSMSLGLGSYTDATENAFNIGKVIEEYFALAAANDERQVSVWESASERLAAWVKVHGSPYLAAGAKPVEEEITAKAVAHLPEEQRPIALDEMRQREANRRRAAKELASLAKEGKTPAIRFLSAIREDGQINAAFLIRPTYRAEYVGKVDHLEAVARFVYVQNKRSLTIESLISAIKPMLEKEGREESAVSFVLSRITQIIGEGRPWCLDLNPKSAVMTDPDMWDALVPSDEYYSGSVWPKYDRLNDLLAVLTDDAQLFGVVPVAVLKQQKKKMIEVIKPETFAEIEDTLAVSAQWIPLNILRDFMVDVIIKPEVFGPRANRADLADESLAFELVRDENGVILPTDPRVSERRQAKIEKAKDEARSLKAGEVTIELADEAKAIVDGQERAVLSYAELRDATVKAGDEHKLTGRTRDGKRREVFLIRKAMEFIGYLNNDRGYYNPAKQVFEIELEDKDGNKHKKRIEEDGSMARMRQADEWNSKFRYWLHSQENHKQAIEDAYNRTIRAWVSPTYSSEPMNIPRWTTAVGDRGVTLRPHQAEGARRVLAMRGGVVAFDVGLGKTYTATAIVGAAKAEGWARRPVVCVPNSIVWKWNNDFKRCYPDFNVLVVGSTLVVSDKINPKTGRRDVTSRTDTPEERAQKWARFQAGEYDVALLTHSSLSRTQFTPEMMSRYRDSLLELKMDQLKTRNNKSALKNKARIVDEKGKVLNEIAELLDQDVDESKLEGSEKRSRTLKKNKAAMQKAAEGAKTASERVEAITESNVDRFLAEMLEPSKDQRPDGNIMWDELGIDLLIIDEAQNFKNLYPAKSVLADTIKYIGSTDSDGAKRSWQLDARCFAVRERHKDWNTSGGIVLLSATPAKNSPIEFYNLVQYVNPDAWRAVGINTSMDFISRFVKIERDIAPTIDLQTKEANVCRQFMNLHEMRAVVHKWCNYKIAANDADNLKPEEKAYVVNVQVPESNVIRVPFDMSDEQMNIYEMYRERIREASESDDWEEKKQIIGYMQRMSLATIHPALAGNPNAISKDRKEALEKINKIKDEDKREAALEAYNARDESEDVEMHINFNNASQHDATRSPKLMRVVANVMKKHDCGHIIFCESTAAHYWLRELLVKKGMKRDRIAILNSLLTKEVFKRQEIAEGFNGALVPNPDDPEGPLIRLPALYDVVIANQVANEGIDLQVRTCAIHHVDLPWEPATLQQRNGRGVRQGNKTEAPVDIYYYLANKSFDGVRLVTIMQKLSWLESLVKGQARNTNNPSAQSDISYLDIILGTTHDGEQAAEMVKRQREAIRQREIEVRRSAAAKESRRINGLYLSAQRTADPERAAMLRQQATNQVNTLAGYPPEEWPWLRFVREAMQTQPIIYLDQFKFAPLYDGLRLGLRSPIEGDDTITFYEIGQVNVNKAEFSISVRQLGSITWETHDAIKWMRDNKVDVSSYEHPWPTEIDVEQIKSQVSSLVVSRGRALFLGDIIPAGVASEYYICAVYRLKRPILMALANSRDGGSLLPPYVDGAHIRLLDLYTFGRQPDRDDRIFEQVLNPTRQNLERVLQYAERDFETPAARWEAAITSWFRLTSADSFRSRLQRPKLMQDRAAKFDPMTIHGEILDAIKKPYVDSFAGGLASLSHYRSIAFKSLAVQIATYAESEAAVRARDVAFTRLMVMGARAMLEQYVQKASQNGEVVPDEKIEQYFNSKIRQLLRRFTELMDNANYETYASCYADFSIDVLPGDRGEREKLGERFGGRHLGEEYAEDRSAFDQNERAARLISERIFRPTSTDLVVIEGGYAVLPAFEDSPHLVVALQRAKQAAADVLTPAVLGEMFRRHFRAYVVKFAEVMKAAREADKTKSKKEREDA